MNIAYIADIKSVHNLKWIKHFAKNNNVIIICEKYVVDSPVVIENCKIYPVLPRTYPLKNYILRAKTTREIKQLLKVNKIEILHSMYAVPYALWAYHSKFKNHIATTRGSDMLVDYKITYSKANGLKNSIVGYFMKSFIIKALNNARYITSTSISQQNVLRTFIKDNKKLILIRTGVNVKDFLASYSSLTKTESGITILSNRAMSSLYNIDIIVEAFSLLISKHGFENVKLCLLKFNANKDYVEAITKLIDKLEISDKVNIIVCESNDMLMQAYKNADCVVMVPKSDGTPVSGIESMLAKNPLIVGSVNYDEDIFNDATVWKIDNLSANTLADKMNEVLNLTTVSREKKVNTAFNAANEKADLSKSVDRIEYLYNELIGLH